MSVDTHLDDFDVVEQRNLLHAEVVWYQRVEAVGHVENQCLRSARLNYLRPADTRMDTRDVQTATDRRTGRRDTPEQTDGTDRWTDRQTGRTEHTERTDEYTGDTRGYTNGGYTGWHKRRTHRVTLTADTQGDTNGGHTVWHKRRTHRVKIQPRCLREERQQTRTNRLPLSLRSVVYTLP